MEQLLVLNFNVFGNDVEKTFASKNLLVLKQPFQASLLFDFARSTNCWIFPGVQFSFWEAVKVYTFLASFSLLGE
jgi:hypothetical protein